jgi:tetratricopeptide (TPR) repeat protein
MQAKRKNWKDVIDSRRRENFVGRAEYLSLFSDNFIIEVPTYLLFTVIGEGGVGKSTLLNQYENIVSGQKIQGIPIICDENQLSPVTVMGHVAEKLARFDIKHKEFNERYKAYRTHREEIESDPKAPRGAINLVVRGMTEFAIKAARKTPGVGVFAEYVDEKEASEALSQGVGYLIDRFSNRDEVRLLREPENILTPLFIELLNLACEKHRIVLMFDVFERTSETLEPWLIECLNFKYGECDTNLTFVISGRDPIDQHWTEIASSICHVSLEPFTVDETRLYLANRSITDESLVKQIHEDTGGLPVLVELLAGTNPKPGLPLPDISKDAVRRFLQWIPEEERRRVALLAAVPRQFNLDILNASLGVDAETQFLWLSTQSYIRTSKIRGWFYHEKVRELMLRYLHNTISAELEATHRRLVKYFEEKQEQLKSVQSSEIWHSFEVERVYHLLSEQPVSNIGMAVNAFLSTTPSNCNVGDSIPLACQQVGREKVSHEVQEWSRMLIDFYKACENDEHEALLRLANLLAQRNDLNEKAQYVLYAKRAETHRQMKLYQEALDDSTRAIEIYKGCFALVTRGKTYSYLGEHEKALSDFNQITTQIPNCKSAILSSANTYCLMGEYSDSVAACNKVIADDKEDSGAIARRGETYRCMGKYSDALADFDRAIEIDRDYHWAYEQRGRVLKKLGRYEEAVKSLTEAERTSTTCATCIEERSKVYQLMGKFLEALADYEKLITIYKDDESIGQAISERGEICRLMEKFSEALADFDKAISLGNKSSSSIAWRGEMHRRLGNFDEAVRDLTLAIDLDPEQDSFPRSRRAAVYQVIGDKIASESDVTHVRHVPPEDLADFYNHAVVCSLSGQSAEAIGFLKEAIERSALARYYALTDDLFESLKSFPEYQELMITKQKI